MARIEIEEPQPAALSLSRALLRIVVGVIMTAHGWLKLSDFSSWYDQVVKLGLPFPEIAAPLAVAGELLGGLGLVFGLFTRLAAFGVACVMVVAIAKVHLPHGLLAQNGGFEFPLVLLASALGILIAGPDPLCLDTLLRRRARHRAIARDQIWNQPPYIEHPVPDEVLYDEAGRRRRGRDPRRPPLDR